MSALVGHEDTIDIQSIAYSLQQLSEFSESPCRSTPPLRERSAFTRRLGNFSAQAQVHNPPREDREQRPRRAPQSSVRQDTSQYRDARHHCRESDRQRIEEPPEREVSVRLPTLEELSETIPEAQETQQLISTGNVLDVFAEPQTTIPSRGLAPRSDDPQHSQMVADLGMKNLSDIPFQVKKLQSIYDPALPYVAALEFKFHGLKPTQIGISNIEKGLVTFRRVKENSQPCSMAEINLPKNPGFVGHYGASSTLTPPTDQDFELMVLLVHDANVDHEMLARDEDAKRSIRKRYKLQLQASSQSRRRISPARRFFKRKLVKTVLKYGSLFFVIFSVAGGCTAWIIVKSAEQQATNSTTPNRKLLAVLIKGNDVTWQIASYALIQSVTWVVDGVVAYKLFSFTRYAREKFRTLSCLFLPTTFQSMFLFLASIGKSGPELAVFLYVIVGMFFPPSFLSLIPATMILGIGLHSALSKEPSFSVQALLACLVSIFTTISIKVLAQRAIESPWMQISGSTDSYGNKKKPIIKMAQGTGRAAAKLLFNAKPYDNGNEKGGEFPAQQPQTSALVYTKKTRAAEGVVVDNHLRDIYEGFSKVIRDYDKRQMLIKSIQSFPEDKRDKCLQMISNFERSGGDVAVRSMTNRHSSTPIFRSNSFCNSGAIIKNTFQGGPLQGFDFVVFTTWHTFDDHYRSEKGEVVCRNHGAKDCICGGYVAYTIIGPLAIVPVYQKEDAAFCGIFPTRQQSQSMIIIANCATSFAKSSSGSIRHFISSPCLDQGDARGAAYYTSELPPVDNCDGACKSNCIFPVESFKGCCGPIYDEKGEVSHLLSVITGEKITYAAEFVDFQIGDKSEMDDQISGKFEYDSEYGDSDVSPRIVRISTPWGIHEMTVPARYSIRQIHEAAARKGFTTITNNTDNFALNLLDVLMLSQKEAIEFTDENVAKTGKAADKKDLMLKAINSRMCVGVLRIRGGKVIDRYFVGEGDLITILVDERPGGEVLSIIENVDYLPPISATLKRASASKTLFCSTVCEGCYRKIVELMDLKPGQTLIDPMAGPLDRSRVVKEIATDVNLVSRDLLPFTSCGGESHFFNGLEAAFISGDSITYLNPPWTNTHFMDYKDLLAPGDFMLVNQSYTYLSKETITVHSNKCKCCNWKLLKMPPSHVRAVSTQPKDGFVAMEPGYYIYGGSPVAYSEKFYTNKKGKFSGHQANPALKALGAIKNPDMTQAFKSRIEELTNSLNAMEAQRGVDANDLRMIRQKEAALVEANAALRQKNAKLEDALKAEMNATTTSETQTDEVTEVSVVEDDMDVTIRNIRTMLSNHQRDTNQFFAEFKQQISHEESLRNRLVETERELLQVQGASCSSGLGVTLQNMEDLLEYNGKFVVKDTRSNFTFLHSSISKKLIILEAYLADVAEKVGTGKKYQPLYTVGESDEEEEDMEEEEEEEEGDFDYRGASMVIEKRDQTRATGDDQFTDKFRKTTRSTTWNPEDIFSGIAVEDNEESIPLFRSHTGTRYKATEVQDQGDTFADRLFGTHGVFGSFALSRFIRGIEYDWPTLITLINKNTSLEEELAAMDTDDDIGRAFNQLYQKHLPIELMSLLYDAFLQLTPPKLKAMLGQFRNQLMSIKSLARMLCWYDYRDPNRPPITSRYRGIQYKNIKESIIEEAYLEGAYTALCCAAIGFSTGLVMEYKTPLPDLKGYIQKYKKEQFDTLLENVRFGTDKVAAKEEEKKKDVFAKLGDMLMRKPEQTRGRDYEEKFDVSNMRNLHRETDKTEDFKQFFRAEDERVLHSRPQQPEPTAPSMAFAELFDQKDDSFLDQPPRFYPSAIDFIVKTPVETKFTLSKEFRQAMESYKTTGSVSPEQLRFLSTLSYQKIMEYGRACGMIPASFLVQSLKVEANDLRKSYRFQSPNQNGKEMTNSQKAIVSAMNWLPYRLHVRAVATKRGALEILKMLSDPNPMDSCLWQIDGHPRPSRSDISTLEKFSRALNGRIEQLQASLMEFEKPKKRLAQLRLPLSRAGANCGPPLEDSSSSAAEESIDSLSQCSSRRESCTEMSDRLTYIKGEETESSASAITFVPLHHFRQYGKRCRVKRPNRVREQ